MDARLARRLVRSLASTSVARLRRLRAAFLPDFFVDHFVAFPRWRSTAAEMRRVHDRGGGFLVAGPQRLLHGGNAANAALALARLGARVSLLARTDPVGLSVLRPFAAGVGLDVSRVRSDGRLAVTLAAEFAGTGANVMVAEPGSVADFGPEGLDDADWRLLEGCDAVGVVNWAKNRRGTDLASRVFRRVRSAGGRTFLDSADPTGRENDLAAFGRRVLRRDPPDAWGLNENELRWFSPAGVGDAAARLRSLQRTTPARLDLHARRWAATTQDGGLVRVDSFPAGRRRRSTGAGDAWNAGNMLGDLLGLPADERLLLAHAVAGYYVTAPEPEHPTLARALRFVRARLA